MAAAVVVAAATKVAAAVAATKAAVIVVAVAVSTKVAAVAAVMTTGVDISRPESFQRLLPLVEAGDFLCLDVKPLDSRGDAGEYFPNNRICEYCDFVD